MDIESKKRAFISDIAKVVNREEAAANAIMAALQHNPTYASADVDRLTFRTGFVAAMNEKLDQYRQTVSDDQHCAIIDELADGLSAQFRTSLKNGRLRVGTVQKALNLYLKTVWCLELGFATPPHCPVDRIVLLEAGIYGNWTQLDSMETYRHWIDGLRAHAKSVGFESLAEWELCNWGR